MILKATQLHGQFGDLHCHLWLPEGKSALWLFNIAMGNGPFIDGFPIKTSIYKGVSMAMSNNQMVCLRCTFWTFGWGTQKEGLDGLL
jgi:hypothetical protein